MSDVISNLDEVAALYRQFEDLFKGEQLSDEEKSSLAQEVLEIIFSGSEEVLK